jgi:hypothetical protein
MVVIEDYVIKDYVIKDYVITDYKMFGCLVQLVA